LQLVVSTVAQLLIQPFKGSYSQLDLQGASFLHGFGFGIEQPELLHHVLECFLSLVDACQPLLGRA
jgi:hypothetical protein